MAEISAEQFALWRQHPVTQYVFAQLREQRERIFNRIGSGETINSDSADSTQMQTSMAVGTIQGLDFVLNIKHVEEDE